MSSIIAWLFKSGTPSTVEKKREPGRLPECTNDEYNAFLDCMKRGDRRFQTAGRTINDEYAAWLKHHRSKLARTKAHEPPAESANPAQSAPELTDPA